jgi:hypothetical protein
MPVVCDARGAGGLVGDRRRIEDHDVGVGTRGEPPLAGASRARGLQATGSAHAVLGPLWAGRLGRCRLSTLQASPAAAAWPSPSTTTRSTSAVTPSPSPEGNGSSNPNPVTRNPDGAVCLTG